MICVGGKQRNCYRCCKALSKEDEQKLWSNGVLRITTSRALKECCLWVKCLALEEGKSFMKFSQVVWHVNPGQYEYQEHVNPGQYEYQEHVNPGQYEYQEHVNPGQYEYQEHVNPGQYEYQEHVNPGQYEYQEHVNPGQYEYQEHVNPGQYEYQEHVNPGQYEYQEHVNPGQYEYQEHVLTFKKLHVRKLCLHFVGALSWKSVSCFCLGPVH